MSSPPFTAPFTVPKIRAPMVVLYRPTSHQLTCFKISRPPSKSCLATIVDAIVIINNTPAYLCKMSRGSSTAPFTAPKIHVLVVVQYRPTSHQPTCVKMSRPPCIVIVVDITKMIIINTPAYQCGMSRPPSIAPSIVPKMQVSVVVRYRLSTHPLTCVEMSRPQCIVIIVNIIRMIIINTSAHQWGMSRLPSIAPSIVPKIRVSVVVRYRLSTHPLTCAEMSRPPCIVIIVNITRMIINTSAHQWGMSRPPSTAPFIAPKIRAPVVVRYRLSTHPLTCAEMSRPQCIVIVVDITKMIIINTPAHQCGMSRPPSIAPSIVPKMQVSVVVRYRLSTHPLTCVEMSRPPCIVIIVNITRMIINASAHQWGMSRPPSTAPFIAPKIRAPVVVRYRPTSR